MVAWVKRRMLVAIIALLTGLLVGAAAYGLLLQRGPTGTQRERLADRFTVELQTAAGRDAGSLSVAPGAGGRGTSDLVFHPWSAASSGPHGVLVSRARCTRATDDVSRTAGDLDAVVEPDDHLRLDRDVDRLRGHSITVFHLGARGRLEPLGCGEVPRGS